MIGIDLGSKFIKICKIINSGNKKKEHSVISAALDISNVPEKEKANKLLSVLNKLSCLDESVYLAVGGKDIINRNISLKRNKDIKLEEQIANEAAGTISEDLRKMYTSFVVLKNDSEKDYNVIFSAAPIDKINKKFVFINSIKTMSVAGVTSEDFALTNAFNEFGPKYKNTENIVLINIGHKVSNIVVLKNTDLVFVNDVDFGGQNITKDIATFFSVPEKLSEEIKRREDLRQAINFNMKNILKKNVIVLAENIFKTIEHCKTKQLVDSIDRIVLTGGGALTDGIDNFIQDTLGIPTEKWNPLSNNEFVGYVDKDKGFYLPIALGLALEKEKKANV